MNKLLKDMLTGKDNATYDVSRVCGILGVLTFLGLEIFQVVARHTAFDMQTFGIGFGAVIAAMGAAVRLKASTEPSP